MAAKGYCAYTDIEAFLGKTLTSGQQAHCVNLIERAEKFIDEETNRGWLVGAQTDEAHFYPGYDLYLKYSPVASVTAVTGRAALGETETTLVANTDYEVRSLADGYIYLLYPGNYDRVLVDYTPVNAAPADIKHACVELVASWMQPNFQPGTYGLDSIQLPDYTVRYARSHVQEAAPPTVQRILDRYRLLVHG